MYNSVIFSKFKKLYVTITTIQFCNIFINPPPQILLNLCEMISRCFTEQIWKCLIMECCSRSFLNGRYSFSFWDLKNFEFQIYPAAEVSCKRLWTVWTHPIPTITLESRCYYCSLFCSSGNWGIAFIQGWMECHKKVQWGSRRENLWPLGL